jgi:hypothetical protein
MYYTTLNKIWAFDPSEAGRDKLLHSLGKAEPDDEPVSMKEILVSLGIEDALWCIRTLDEETIVRFSHHCAKKVLPIFEKGIPHSSNTTEASTSAVIDAMAVARFAANAISYSAVDTVAYASAVAAVAIVAASAAELRQRQKASPGACYSTVIDNRPIKTELFAEFFCQPD